MVRTGKFTVPVVAGVAAVAAAGTALTVHSATAASTDSRAAWPKGISAPYTDIGLYPQADLAGLQQSSGNHYLTLSFVTDPSNGCDVKWGNGESLDSGTWAQKVKDLRDKGGEVAVSIGGSVGTDPATSCTSAADLQKQYQRVVDAFSLTHLDLDIEGAALTNTAANDRRSTAVAALEKANPNLWVSYTLPVMPTGLTDSGTALLSNAHQHGVKLGVVNGMAMDYGSPNSDMGGAAISAGTAIKSQIQAAYPGTSDSEAWSMVGVTPMIGQNDSAGEVFTLKDATQLVSWAKEKHIGRLAYWSTARDNGNCAGQTTASATCSGLSQENGAFAKIFATFHP